MFRDSDKKATLLLKQWGYDKNGRKIRKKKRAKSVKLTKNQRRQLKNIVSGNSSKIIRQNAALIEQRKKSELSDVEVKIADFLVSEQISFTREYYMKGLFNPKTRKPLFFDFYIRQYNLVIEYDGLHHFKNEKNPEKLKEQKYKDGLKTRFCEKHKIYLLRIPYWKQGRIEKLICEKVDQILAA